MVRLDRAFIAVYFASLVLALAGIVAGLSGNARPYVGPEQVPFGPSALIFGFALLLVVGFFAIGRVSAVLWQRAASGAGLSPVDGSGDDTYTTYGDARHGHPVRATVVSNREGDSGYAVTMVEALPSARQASGVVVQPESANGIRAVALDDAVGRDGVVAASNDPGLARRVVDRLDPEVMSAPGRAGQVFAGDTHAVIKATGALLDSRTGNRGWSDEDVETIRDEFGAVGNVIHDEVEGLETSAATVVHYSAGPVLDRDELEDQIAAVVAVARAMDA
jgi:hypothetical protein